MTLEIDLRERPLRVGVAGLGVIGKQHARILSSMPSVELVGVCDLNAETAQDVAGQAGCSGVSSWQSLIDLELDAVVNALPTHLHYESTRLFLEANLHVLVEKPIASTPSEADEMIKLARENGKVLAVGHVERFNAAVQELKQQVDSGRLGDIISVVTRRVGVARPSVPQANVALDLAIHDVDVLRFVLGEPADLVSWHGRSIAGNQLEDHVDLVLRYGTIFATVQVNWITPVKIRRLSLVGTKGTAELDYIKQELHIYEAVPEVIKGSPWDFFAVSKESDPVTVPVERSEPLRAELQDFIQSVTQGRPPMVPAAHARDALEIVVEATENIQMSLES